MTSPHSARAAFLNSNIGIDGIRAVGFDLDHSLAVYDDDAVNRLACEETAHLLVDQLGYKRDILDFPYDGSAVARGIGYELSGGGLIKIDSMRRVRRALRDGRWLGTAALSDNYPISLPPSTVHELHSPFDLPTGWLLMTLDAVGTSREPDRRCREVRTLLDRAHTRGVLKRRIVDNMSRLVRPLDDASVFSDLRDRGVTMFILTNSSYDYALALLDYLFEEAGGAHWSELFTALVVDAGKPAFFEAQLAPRATQRRGVTHIVDGGSVHALESILGAAGSEIVYAGDHALYDVAAAKHHGWHATHIVPELAWQPAQAAWGSVFEEEGTRTWFAHLVASADAFADSVESFAIALRDKAFAPRESAPGDFTRRPDYP